VNAAALPGWVGRRFVHAFREVLPPTLFFLFSFNLIVFTTNLLVHDYWFKVSSFLIATTTALVVGKAVLVVNHIRLIDRYRGAPLIQPILYKALFYTLVVLVVRLAERFIHLAIDDRGFAAALDLAVYDFSWRRFAAIQIWIFTCFLIYVTATELSRLLGEGQLFRLFFRHRSNQHRLTRRQHVRALMELSRLAETTPREQLLDAATPQGQRLVSIVDALRQRPG
jgi:chromate transport protein ChrA